MKIPILKTFRSKVETRQALSDTRDQIIKYDFIYLTIDLESYIHDRSRKHKEGFSTPQALLNDFTEISENTTIIT